MTIKKTGCSNDTDLILRLVTHEQALTQTNKVNKKRRGLSIKDHSDKEKTSRKLS